MKKTPITETRIRYSDFRNDLQIHPMKKDLISIKNEDAVKNSIKNLIFTGPYERRFRPMLGAGLQKYLFENISPITGQLIRASIIKTIETFEPRATLLDVIVQVNPDYNSYTASIIFRVINNSDPVILNLILDRVR